jgi:hypothetical protein
VRVDVEAVYVDGNWKFLWLRAKPKLVPWIDLKMFSTEGVLFLQSIRDARFRSEISFNETENALGSQPCDRVSASRRQLDEAESLI